MATSTEIENRIRLLNERLAGCIPPRETWTPADEALYKPLDILRVPLDEAQAMQFKAIKYAFKRHYTHNRFYHNYCEKQGVTPDDLKTNGDFDKIPLIPDTQFKQHPSGKDLAYWISAIFTGDLPHIVIEGANPTFDDIINAFNAQAGLEVAFSTGTSGQHTVVPRDRRTLRSYVYVLEKMQACMVNILADHAMTLYPKPSQTNFLGGKISPILALAQKDHYYAMEFEVTADLAQKAMRGEDRHETASQSAEETKQKIVGNVIDFLTRYEKTTDTICLQGPSTVFLMVADALERAGKRFDFGERGALVVGGGFKKSEHEHMTAESYRKWVAEMLGVPDRNISEGYGMTETNAAGTSCPEGHYYHLPYTFATYFVLDNNLEPVGAGERGRLAILDGLAYSYPSFVISGDEVRMFEHCPACDRLGPAFDEIDRAQSVEVRSCSEVLRRTIEQGLEG
jgi:phenylacetate-coenzyme A ligase PaaK-like adenylate-forming protein